MHIAKSDHIYRQIYFLFEAWCVYMWKWIYDNEFDIYAHEL